jgi:hypothetical protein
MPVFTVTQWVNHAPLACFDNFDSAKAWAQIKADELELTNRRATIHLVIDSWIGDDCVTSCHVYGTLA